MGTVLIIGRFQPFHIGHYNAIKSIIETKDIGKVIIGIGSAQLKDQIENPFSYDERKLMIEMSFKNRKDIEIYPITDINNYDKWVNHLVGTVPNFDYVLTNNEITRKLFENSKYKVKNFPIKNIISATEIREMVVNGDTCSTLLPVGTKIVMKEVKGYDRIKQLYKKVYRNPTPATDAIIQFYDGSNVYKGIVLVERKNPPHGLALPGGFHEYGLSAEDNMVKEAKEETGLDIKILGQLGTYSDPKRDPRKHVISTVFVANGYGKHKAGDDAKKVFVLQSKDVPDLVFDHNKIIKDYLKWDPK